MHQFSSVQFSHLVVSNALQPHESQHTRPPCPSPTPGVYSNSCPSNRWCHPAISFSVIPFSCPQSLPASGSFPMSQLFARGGQRIGVSASASVLPMNTKDWCPLRWTGWISLHSKGLSRVFSNTTVQKPLAVWITINWKILKEMDIPDYLTCLLRNLYAGQEATVRTGHGPTDWFQIGKGVCQGCILSLCLFNLYAEYIMRNTGLEETQAGIKIARRNINNLRYADDTTLMAESEELKSFLMKVREWKS